MEIHCKTQVHLLFCVYLEKGTFSPSAVLFQTLTFTYVQKCLSWMHKDRTETIGLTAAKCSVA